MNSINIPTVGSRVKVTTRYKETYIYSDRSWRDTVLEGEVVASNKWDQPNTFKLHTGNPDFPDSVVSLDYVHDIKYLTGGAGRSVSVDQRTWTVEGSKGDKYVVAQQGSRWTCTCSGFQYRKNCRHIKEKQDD